MGTTEQRIAHYASEVLRWIYADPASNAGHSARIAAQYAFMKYPELREEQSPSRQ
jgi:hypothetical protein